MTDDTGFFRNLVGFANDWVSTKRRKLNSKPQTKVDSGGSTNQVHFGGQDISRSELREVKQIRESGGIITSAFDAKALIRFGTGVEFDCENDDLQQWLEDNLPNIDLTVLEMGEDATYYPWSLGEMVENRVGGFSHIEHIEPWTMLPMTDEYGDIVQWEQEIGGTRETEIFQTDEIGSIILNKSSGRDKTGISDVLQNQEEIETFRSNQQAMREATSRLGWPFRHAKAGREGAAQLNDNELRRIRNRLVDIGPGETLTTGPDVELNQMEPPTIDFGSIQERDTRMLSTAIGLPIELLNEGSDGLGSGAPADARIQLFALQNEAARRRFAVQFTDEYLRPIVRKFSPFDHTEDMGIQIQPFLNDKSDMAGLIQQVGDYMTANEVRNKLDMAPIEDEEIGESYQTPADETSDGDDEGLPFFNSDSRSLQDVEDIDTGDYPQAARENAQMALDARDDTGNPNDCGTRVGWERANQLANGEDLSEDTIGRMSNFSRHEDNKEQGEEGREDCGWLMWNAWGGDEGIEWAARKVDEFEEARQNAELSAKESAEQSRFESSGHEVDTDFSTDGMEPWEQDMLDLQQRIWSADNDKQLVSFTETAMPEFVKERMRESILSGALFSQFDTVPSNKLQELRNTFAEQLTDDGWTTDSVTDAVMDLEDSLSRNQAETIARTETASIVNTAREEGYRETGMADEKFYWTGATQSEQPERTTDACDWLIQQTNPNHGGEPVKMERLKELIEEAPTHDPDMDDNLARPENYVVHPNERKTWVRHV